jgi:hypothetical protein
LHGFLKNHAKLFGGLLNDYERPSKNVKVNQQHNLTKKETEVSLKLIIMLLMKYKQLTYEQRYAIYLDLKEGTSKKNIALRIGVHISTLYRELKQNKNMSGGYSLNLAHETSMLIPNTKRDK